MLSDTDTYELFELLSTLMNVPISKIKVEDIVLENSKLSYRFYIDENKKICKEIKKSMKWAFPKGDLHPFIQHFTLGELSNTKISIRYLGDNSEASHKLLSFHTLGVCLLYLLYLSIVLIVIYISCLYILGCYYLGKKYMIPFIKYLIST